MYLAELVGQFLVHFRVVIFESISRSFKLIPVINNELINDYVSRTRTSFRDRH